MATAGRIGLGMAASQNWGIDRGYVLVLRLPP
jgi:hypothetical protein